MHGMGACMLRVRGSWGAVHETAGICKLEGERFVRDRGLARKNKTAGWWPCMLWRAEETKRELAADMVRLGVCFAGDKPHGSASCLGEAMQKQAWWAWPYSKNRATIVDLAWAELNGLFIGLGKELKLGLILGYFRAKI